MADFYCAECPLVVELDGAIHADRVAYDARRTAWLARYGIRVIRFRNEQLDEQFEQVVAEIRAACRAAVGE